MAQHALGLLEPVHCPGLSLADVPVQYESATAVVGRSIPTAHGVVIKGPPLFIAVVSKKKFCVAFVKRKEPYLTFPDNINSLFDLSLFHPKYSNRGLEREVGDLRAAVAR